MMSAAVFLAACSSDEDPFMPEEMPKAVTGDNSGTGEGSGTGNGTPEAGSDGADDNPTLTKYVDEHGDVAYIPSQFSVSANADERTIGTGLVVIGSDGSEFVWVPTAQTALQVREFGSYFSGGSISDYWDETSLPQYQAMVQSVARYGGFFMGRYEASYGSGSSLDDYVPASKRVTPNEPGRIWVQFSPQDATVACQNLYRDNPTVEGFFPWGANWDTVLQWLIDSGCKSREEVVSNSTSWGNYSDDTFSPGANGQYTGMYEEAKANNIYDLAGNNWEWTQERCGGSNYVMRGGGYNLMGGACSGSRYPAALRDPLPGNNHHPNVCFRVALFLLPVADNTSTGIRPVTM